MSMFARNIALSVTLTVVLCAPDATLPDIDVPKLSRKEPVVNTKRNTDNTDHNIELPVAVSKLTTVNKKRGVIAGPIDFPKDMQFIIKFGKSELALNLKKHETMSTDITLSDEFGAIEHDLWRTVGIYYDDSNMASMVVECHENSTECSLLGSVVFGGEKWIISPNVKNPQFHTARRAILEDEHSAGVSAEAILKQTGGSLKQAGSKAEGAVYFTFNLLQVATCLLTRNRLFGKRRRQGRDIYPHNYDNYYNTLPDCYIIETVAAVDESVWYFFLEWADHDPVEAEKMLIKYYCLLYTEIDRRFSGFNDVTGYDDCKCIRIYLAEVHITKNEDDSWSKPAETEYNGKTVIKGKALKKCGQKLQSKRDEIAQYDVAQCYTRKHIVWFAKEEPSEVGVLAYEDVACATDLGRKQVSLIQDKGDATDRRAARGIARNMGARTDGKVGCDDNDRYIMSDLDGSPYSYYQYTSANWLFSDCSERDICLFIKGLYDNCFLDHGFTTKEFWAKLKKPLPGKVYSLKEQCELRFGHSSEPCNEGYPQDICGKGISCTNDYECTGRTRVFSGTPCGDDKICYKGECVEDTGFDNGNDTDGNGKGSDICEDCAGYDTCNGDNLQCVPVNSYQSQCLCVDPYYVNSCGECVLDDDDCDDDNCEQICTDTVGSYVCSCEEGYILNSDGYSCDDIDECATNNGYCQQICTNTDGSYDCSCNYGFELENGLFCEDINECAYNNGGCEQFCDNTPGSYECECCDGYTLAYNGQDCDDVNECNYDNGGCEQICANMPGSFCCDCDEGYELSSDDHSCDDINECDTNNGGCEQICTNNDGSFDCSCHPGYELGYNGLSCDDINECVYDNGGCEQFCDNTPGSYECECGVGYELAYNGEDCDDVDECYYDNGGCEQICTNVPGSFCCDCNEGYELSTDCQSCDAVDICDDNNGDCEQICMFDGVSSVCSCYYGYTLSDNGLCCDDINECLYANGGCEQFCDNTPGSFNCQCCYGYNLGTDGFSCVYGIK